MLATVIKTCPSADNDFEQLSDYQSQTPQTFFDGKPILHAHDRRVKAWVSEEQHERLFFFSSPSASSSTGSSGDDATPGAALTRPSPPHNAALDSNGEGMREEAEVEVFVASNKLTLFSRRTNTGIEITYPAVTLHAVKNFRNNTTTSTNAGDDASARFEGVYMQLEFSDTSAGQDDDESFEPIEVTLIPYGEGAGAGENGGGEDQEQPAQQQSSSNSSNNNNNSQRTSTLFAAISRCSNLNPDPRDPGDEDDDDADEFIDEDGNADRIIFEGDILGDTDGAQLPYETLDGFSGAFRGASGGGLPAPMPGSSGWITAENVDQFFDADGNWIGGGGGAGNDGFISGELGEGAGRVRGRDEVEGQDDGTGGGAAGQEQQNGVNGHHHAEDGDAAKRPRTE